MSSTERRRSVKRRNRFGEEEGYYHRHKPDDYNYVYHESTYDDSFWWVLFGIFALFVFLLVVAAFANYHVNPDDDCCDDDAIAPIVRETQRAIEEDPTENKKNEAFKILKKSLKERGGVNGKSSSSSSHPPLFGEDPQCPSGMIHSKGGQYALLSTSQCLPNYTSPVAVDESIVKGYNKQTGVLNVDADRSHRCKSFSDFACSSWKGTGGRSFTYSTMTNKKVLRMVENLDAIGDHLHWNPDSGVEKDERSDGEDSHETIASEREVFSTYIQKCHSTLDEISSDLTHVKHHKILGEMIHATFLFEGIDWYGLGSAFGVSSCIGVNPLFHMRTETDLFDNSEPLFYIQPKGFVGLETSVRKRSAYIRNACSHILEYTKKTKDSTPDNFVDLCYTSVISLEKELGKALQKALDDDNRNSKDDSFGRFIGRFEMSGESSTSDDDKRKLASQSSEYFSGDFFAGFMEKLVQCTLGEEAKPIDKDKMYVWTEYTEYFDRLHEIMNPPKKLEQETFDEFRMALITSLAVDNLEVIGFFAAHDYDHIVDGGSISNEQPSSFERKDKTFTQPPEHGFLSRGFIPYNSDISDTSPRVIRLNGDRKHSIIRKRNIEKISRMSQRNKGEEAEIDEEPFALSSSADWTNYAWFTCIDIAQTYFPEIVDNSFASFTTTVKDRSMVARLTDTLLNSLVQDMQSSRMLDNKTKVALTDKTQHILKRIAVPWETNIAAEEEEEFRLRQESGMRYPIPVDHSEIGMQGKDFYEDTILIRRWAIRQEIKDYLQRINARGEIKRNGVKSLHFSMKTSETNAYYSPLENNINILSGIMKPPFFHKDYTKTSLYATMGSIVGHELSHSLDKTGVLFDKYGNLNVSMLSSKARGQYEEREQCFVDQYKKYATLLGNEVDAEKTLSENIADNAGIQAAWDALRKELNNDDEKTSLNSSPEMLIKTAKEFTLAYAQMWCTNRDVDEEKFIMSIDVHSPPQVRIDRTLSNLIDKETGRYVMNIGWGCEEHDRMVHKPRCAVF